MDDTSALIPVGRIEHAILTVRGQRVMLDADLAALYGVEVRALNQAVRRNLDRFPEDFAFQLSGEEWSALRSQTVISNVGRGGRRYPPFAFTEHGALALAGVLNTSIAAAMSVMIVRAFVKMRQMLAAHEDILRRLDMLEAGYHYHDAQITAVFEAIRHLMAPPDLEPKRIGFRADDEP